MEGTTFGDVPLNVELKLEVWDSPNSAGVITDAIRCLKLGLDRGLSGTLVAPSSYFMKSPPIQIHDDIAFNRVEAFIRGEDNETLVGHGSRQAAQEPRSWPRRGACRPPRRMADAAATSASGAQGREPAAEQPRRTPLGATAASTYAPHRRIRTAARRRTPCSAPASGPSCARYRAASAALGARRPREHRSRSRGRSSWAATTPGRPSGASSWPTPPTSWASRPDDPEVRRLARRIYATYARFALELMRLPGRPADEPLRLVPPRASAATMRSWRSGSAVAAEGRGHHRGLAATSAASRSSRAPYALHGMPDLRPGRRHRVPGAVRAAQPPARALGSDDHPLAQPARHLPRHAPPGACWAWSSTGATGPTTCPCACSGPGRRCPRDPPRSRHGRGAVILPVVARRQPDGTLSRRRTATRSRSPDTTRAELQRATQAHRRCARGHGAGRARPVVHVQAHVAGDGRGGRAWLERGRERCAADDPRDSDGPDHGRLDRAGRTAGAIDP